MKHPYYFAAHRDAHLHWFLYWCGYVLTTIGAAEMILLRDSYVGVFYAGMAMAGSLWWSFRMGEHAEESGRRMRMWS